jgi:predicted secreted protein
VEAAVTSELLNPLMILMLLRFADADGRNDVMALLAVNLRGWTGLACACPEGWFL